MKKLLIAAAATMVAAPAFAQDADSCGAVTITEMNWASASVVTNVANFIMEQGYGCDVSIVPSDTVPAVTSVAENGEPDIVTELWVNGTGTAYARLKEEGLIQELGAVIDPGGVDAWWIPGYLVEAHPELATIDGILANPELVGGRFHNCPEGWGCRVFNDNLLPAFGVEEAGIEIFNHGSGETLATSIAAAFEDNAPWFGYYWAPTAVIGRYDLVQVDMGEYDEAAFKAARDVDSTDVGRSSFPPSPVVTAVTTDFVEEHPELGEFLANMTIETDTMNKVLSWMNDNSATGEEAAVYFLSTYQDVWSGWINDDARENLSALLK
ncbi:glycine/betaine ABC transporter substrate-binding protein [Loktanella sp. D2R18]|uniref:ABC transporter substrate-binding protein n=1 Tax=Rhodobacterales TaxID=204455 RepID=UPI000DE8E152|nr:MULTISPECIES: ABC transporter substrate-binding protein [Rhodobacterales]MDO6591108.1 ABC transporter substrate-binding protein [Yoonia sp. 1_MG-2023]RBW42143.1 glycine/betaine ABC transporter substrate-binding protein [Loktanella sp. D2R18]